MYSKLSQIQREMPGVTISIALSDLKEWSKEIIAETKKQLEQSIIEANTEVYISPKKTAEKLEVDPSTLHRWKVKGYLIPVEVGGKRRYRMSDINRILEGGRRA